ncbi:branched-chain amino acid ABC transporter permease [Brevibacillus agri]|uniref:branched-chain amino acid ABC transporter permease n=1 Tax=Brevibacillus agri TaxID=51101 RepID=UPI0028700FEF|nr:branched-chain amino acid ABC transporter permease [Brevibacillus agri]MDR9505744.1 branched-chain amino acid ABC transporter permease [Brevibacillus agri]MED3499220.1 branched-chain amino acid ABC transporter permease [Brevibacillus agri]
MSSPFVSECGEFRTTYREDMALYKIPRIRYRVYALLGCFLLLPWVVSEYVTSLAVLCAIASIGTIGLNILTGFTGQISIGVGAFLGVGGYASALLTTSLGLSFWISLPLAGIATALVGALFGIPSLRLKGLYLAMATLAAQVIILYAMNHWDGLTGGTAGMILSRPTLGSFSFDSEMSYYYLTLAVLVVTFVFSANLFRSRTGRAFVAVRDRDLAAEVMGINLFRYKVLAFATSSFFIGIAGALMGHYTLVISPEHFDIGVSIEYLAMILIGGLGSVVGSIFGAVFLTLLPVLLRELMDLLAVLLPQVTEHYGAIRQIIFGGIVIGFLIYEPEGLAKMWRNFKEKCKLWPFSY